MIRFITPALLFSLLFLVSCANPNSVKINLDATTKHSHSRTGSFEITAEDVRKSKSVTVIHYSDNSTKSIEASNNPSDLIEQTIIQGLEEAGYAQNSDAKTTLSVELQQLNGRVKQKSVSYKAQLYAKVKVVIQKPNKRVTKEFKGKKQFNGALSLDIKDLEENINTLLSSIVSDIINDRELLKLLSQ